MESLCLVEDDPTIREIVGKRLESVGYAVNSFDRSDFPFREKPWDLFIIDILLSDGKTGFDLCDKVRVHSPTVPVLILSALSDPVDRIQGLNIGADDYLTKPFEMEELLLRVRGMLKRSSWYRSLPTGSIYRWGWNEVDFASYRARRGATPYQLGQKECMLLKLLVEKSGETVPRDEILDRVWGYHVFPSTRTVDNFILRLRKCFEVDPKNPKHIHSVRGVGYRFTP